MDTLAIKSGRGHGKVVMQHAVLEAQRQRAGELLVEMSGVKLLPWQESMYRNIMGSWQYTPADELRNRLNNGLKGLPPAPAVNTRFWRGL